MRLITTTALFAFASLVACSEKASVPLANGTVIVVSDTAYSVGTQMTESKNELLALLKASPVREPVTVNWSIRGGEPKARELAIDRAVEVWQILKEAGISVSATGVGNEIFEAKP